MDFFEHQAVARRKTGRLVLMFIAAVVGIIALSYLAVAIGVMALNGQRRGPQAHGAEMSLWNPLLLVAVGGAVILIVTFSSMVRMGQLSGGGRVVAESMGGQLVNRGTSDPAEQKLLNVVEEMAIASGVPVPDVYVMQHEQGINAFAAGFTHKHAVIGVTRGCIDLLDRDELQGVIAHEFSHILNGDMRLNLRLIGILYGILVIGLIGRMVLSSMRFVGTSGRSRSNGKGGGGGAIIVILGVALALMVIGYIGYFFGGLIKSAVSRQREFLADASAVQFTRYPQGIGGALKKIGGYSFGSRVLSPKAEEVSHMFFGQGVSSWMGSLGATHPPLGERIRRIEPNWDGEFPHVGEPKRVKEQVIEKQAELSRGEARKKALGTLAALGMGAAVQDAQPVTAVQHIGQPTVAHRQRARELLEAIPEPAKDAVHSSLGACAVIYAMLLSDDPAVKRAQFDDITKQIGCEAARETAKLDEAVSRMPRGSALTLLDLAMPGLHELTRGQYESFMRCVEALVKADQHMDLFEWMLGHVLKHRLASSFEPGMGQGPRVKYYALKPMGDALAVLLSTLARYGQMEDESACQQAYEQAMQRLPLDPRPAFLPAKACGIGPMEKALNELRSVGLRQKREVIHACAVCIAADKQVTVEEAELLRTVCDVFACPMPPLLPGQSLV